MSVRRVKSRDPERTRRRLLRAATRLFAAHGFHAVSVDRIVAAARVNKRMVYHYFGSKEDLFAAAFASVYRQIDAAEIAVIEAGGSPRAVLSQLVERYFEFLEREPEFTRFLLWVNLEGGRVLKEAEALLSKHPFLGRFRAVVEAGMRTGAFRRDLDVPQLLIQLIGLCFIYHSNQFTLSRSVGVDLASETVKRRAVAQILGLVFEGIGPRRRI